MNKILAIILVFLTSVCHAASPFDSTKNLPNLYQGRYRSLEATAQMWLYEIHHKRTVDGTPALEVLWDIHLHGPEASYDKPLFWVHYAPTKELLGLDLRRDRFSYRELSQAIKAESGRDNAEVAELIGRLNTFTTEDPLLMVPTAGAWLSLHTLEESSSSEFSNDQLESLRQAYLDLKSASPQDITSAAQRFASAYSDGYKALEGKPYRKASGKALTYPTSFILSLETFYYRTPLIDIAITLYAFALLALAMRSKRAQTIGWILLIAAWITQTITLAMRSYILQRPPVTNMFETVIYVPWIAVALSLVLAWRQHSKIIVIAGSIAAITLLTILKISDLDARMENVQAVLDSQFWLIIHVLMVVGSYGAFILSGIMGHIYLVKWAFGRDKELAPIANGILTSLYIGVGLLIPGTILGGIWAAESWGRFWDWDPKESWAFISACVYLVIIHAYTFRKIRDLGLAIGSILGVISISFTWYGVNYILGTGLHSYGFGSGSPLYYFGYLFAEMLFLAVCCLLGFRLKRNPSSPMMPNNIQKKGDTPP